MWPEGGWLDRADKALSEPFFRTYLGPIEYVLSVPGVSHRLPKRPGMPKLWGDVDIG